MSFKFIRSYAYAAAAVSIVSACQAPGQVTDQRSIVSASKVENPSVVNKQLAELRQATAHFQRFEAAQEARYTTKVTPCWAHHSSGAMGYHYGNTDLFDANVELLKPEVLMYEPQKGGGLKLVGMEYIVPIDAWKNAGHDIDDPNDAPELLGQRFTKHSFLPIYKLHIWLWRDNPEGTFADWNPKVSCASTDEKEIF